jgi:short subunit dehydrogenase-like uncharacterized protein
VAGRIVLFGATGYTGRLTARAMVGRGLRPVLAARSQEKLTALASELGGGLETLTADVSEPRTVRALVERGDVLVTTVGPFARFGVPAVAAACDAGAHYLDSTGEPSFLRRVFEFYSEVGRGNDCAMLTAFGYDYVPGNLAAALALRRAGEAAVSVDVGYFLSGQGSDWMSGGTKASAAGAMAEPGFAFRGGEMVSERGAKRSRSFRVDSQWRPAISIPSSEHFTLPRLAPQLRDVNVYLGWFGSASRALQVASAVTSVAFRVPGVSGLWERATRRLAEQDSSDGAAPEARQGVHSDVVAIAHDAAGTELAQAWLHGTEPYTLTARLLAWGAERAAADGLQGRGALGPVEAFGLVGLTDGCRQAGLAEEGGPTGPETRTAEQAASAS